MSILMIGDRMSLDPLQLALRNKGNLQRQQAGLVVQQRHKRIKRRTATVSSSSARALMPPFKIIVCSDILYKHAPTIEGP